MAEVTLKFSLHGTHDLHVHFEARPPSTPGAVRELYQKRLIRHKIQYKLDGEDGLIIKCGFIEAVTHDEDNDSFQITVLGNEAKGLEKHFPDHGSERPKPGKDSSSASPKFEGVLDRFIRRPPPPQECRSTVSTIKVPCKFTFSKYIAAVHGGYRVRRSPRCVDGDDIVGTGGRKRLARFVVVVKDAISP